MLGYRANFLAIGQTVAGDFSIFKMAAVVRVSEPLSKWSLSLCIIRIIDAECNAETYRLLYSEFRKLRRLVDAKGTEFKFTDCTALNTCFSPLGKPADRAIYFACVNFFFF